jgi:hemoglobin
VSTYERIGGEARLRAVIDDFVDRMKRDTMIGFFFWNVDAERLAQREFEFTARFLGADLPYSGRPIRTAHAQHPIMGGHFERRRRLLEETLIDHGIAPELRAEWLAHVDKLRPAVTRDARGDCNAQPDAEPTSPPKSGFRIIDS